MVNADNYIFSPCGNAWVEKRLGRSKKSNWNKIWTIWKIQWAEEEGMRACKICTDMLNDEAYDYLWEK